jgi:hypothetical protein
MSDHQDSKSNHENDLNLAGPRPLYKNSSDSNTLVSTGSLAPT